MSLLPEHKATLDAIAGDYAPTKYPEDLYRSFQELIEHGFTADEAVSLISSIWWSAASTFGA